MKATINVEFTDDELKKHAADVARRVGLNFIHDVIRHLAAMKIPPGFLDGIEQAIKVGISSGSTPEVDSGPTVAPPATDRCQHIGGTDSSDAFWVCCRCGLLNGDPRVACRKCGHDCCDVIVPPPPPPSTHERTASGAARAVRGTGDLLGKYAMMLTYWPANTIDIFVKRVAGTPVQWVIPSRPNSGAELFEALLKIHGQHEEAEYEVKFLDASSKVYRGVGRIVLPDTRPAPDQNDPSVQ